MDVTNFESAGRMVSATNMRRDENDPQVWRVAGQPTPIRQDAWHPLQQVELTGTNHRAVFMLNGNLLGVITYENKPSALDEHPAMALTRPVNEIGIIYGDPIHFDVVEAGTVKVLMRHRRTIYITYSPTSPGTTPEIAFTLHGSMPDLPEPTLSVEYETTLSEPFGSCTLSGAKGNHSTLNSADTKTMTAHMLWAYKCLRRKADEAGLMIQPTIARCRLLDAAGDTIATTAPVLLSSKAGFQCCSDIALTSTDNLTTLSGGALTARGYRARLTIPRQLTFPWNRIVNSIVVETTEQLTPVDDTHLCSSSLSTDGSATTVRLRLPGVSTSPEANAMRRRSLVMSALSKNAYGQQAMIHTPFTTAGHRTIALNDVECHTMPAFIPLRDARSHRTAHYSKPHGTIILTDPQTEPFNGHTPMSMATDLEQASNTTWQAVATVKILRPDGAETVAVTASTGSGTKLSGFSSLLTYPDADACELSLTVATTAPDGTRTIVTDTYPLTAVPGADMAFHLSDTYPHMMPRAAANALTIPTSTVAPHTEPGLIEICPEHLTTAPYNRIGCSCGAIAAIADAPRSRATWDFARRKLLIFGADGISMATLDANHRLRSAALLDNRPILSPHNICTAHRGHGLEYIAIAGGDLISVTQSSVATLMRNCKGVVPGWCAAKGEIWLLGEGNRTRRISFHQNQIESTAVMLDGNDKIVSFSQWGGKLLLVTGSSMLDAGDERFMPEGTPCAISIRHELPSDTAALSLIRLPVFAEKFIGEIVVSGDNGSRVAEPLVTLDIDGELNAPLNVTMMSPLRLCVEISMEAVTSGDAEIKPPLFKCLTKPT